jgi:uncharacterized membrane protein
MTPEPTNQTKTGFLSDKRIVPFANYGLLFSFLMTIGFGGALALILIYLYQDEAPEWLKSHYSFQKRTFWIAFASILPLFFATGFNAVHNTLFSQIVLIGLFLSLFTWIAARCVMGFNHLFYLRPYPTPKSWFV